MGGPWERGGGGGGDTLDLGLDIVDGVARLYLEGDGFARDCLRSGVSCLVLTGGRGDKMEAYGS